MKNLIKINKNYFISLFCAILFPFMAMAGTLNVTASSNKASTHAGTNVTVTFNIQNIVSPSDDVVLTVPLPAKTQYQTSDSGCTSTTPALPATPVVTCDLGNFGTGETRTVKITIKVYDHFVAGPSENGTGYLNITGNVSSSSGSSSGPATATTEITELADLHLTQITSHINVPAGDVFTYSIFVDNFGPSAARKVVFQISELHEMFKKVSVQSCAFSVAESGGAITQFTCTTGPVNGTQFPVNIETTATDVFRAFQSIDGDFDGDGDPTNDANFFSGRARLSIRMVANEPLVFNSIARVVSLTPDPNMENNESTSVTIVDAHADVSATTEVLGEVQDPGTESLPYSLLNPQPFPEVPGFSTSPIIATAGRRIRYITTINNNGPSDATNVVLTSRLPAGVTVVPGSVNVTPPGDFSCQFGTPGNPHDLMTCGLGTLLGPDPESSEPFPGPIDRSPVLLQYDVIIDHNIDANTVLMNNSTIASSVPDLNNANNFATGFTIVSPLTGVSGCSVGGVFDNVACGIGEATVNLNGFGFALPEAGALSYNWTSNCPGEMFSDATAENTLLTFSSANPDNSPVACEVQLAVENAFASSVCTGIVTVTNCIVDCEGILGGNASLDRCGVCEGNGNSCLGCTTTDLRTNLAEVENSYRTLSNLTIRAAKRIRKEQSTNRARRNAAKIRKAANALMNQNIAALLAIPAAVTSCTNTQFCVSSSNVTELTAAATNSAASLSLFESTAARLAKVSKDRRAARAVKRLRAQAEVSNASAQNALSGIPASSSSCS